MNSIEWLEKEIWRRGSIGEDTQTWLKELYDQAKLLHKQEIIKAFDESQEYYYQYLINHKPKIDSETYYQETFDSDHISDISKMVEEQDVLNWLVDNGYPQSEIDIFKEDGLPTEFMKYVYPFLLANATKQLKTKKH